MTTFYSNVQDALESFAASVREAREYQCAAYETAQCEAYVSDDESNIIIRASIRGSEVGAPVPIPEGGIVFDHGLRETIEGMANAVANSRDRGGCRLIRVVSDRLTAREVAA